MPRTNPYRRTELPAGRYVTREPLADGTGVLEIEWYDGFRISRSVVPNTPTQTRRPDTMPLPGETQEQFEARRAEEEECRYHVHAWDHGFRISAGPSLYTDNLEEAQAYAQTARPRGRETSGTGRNVYDITWRIWDSYRGDWVLVWPEATVRQDDLRQVLAHLGALVDLPKDLHGPVYRILTAAGPQA